MVTTWKQIQMKDSSTPNAMIPGSRAKALRVAAARPVVLTVTVVLISLITLLVSTG